MSRGGTLLAVNPNDKDHAVEGDLEAKVEKDGIVARTAFDLFRDRVGEKTLAQYAEMCGVSQDIDRRHGSSVYLVRETGRSGVLPWSRAAYRRLL